MNDHARKSIETAKKRFEEARMYEEATDSAIHRRAWREEREKWERVVTELQALSEP